MALTASSDAPPSENSFTCLPFETIRREAPRSSAAASALCSFLLAGTVSAISIR